MRSVTSFGSGKGMAQSRCPVWLKVDMAGWSVVCLQEAGKS